MKKLLNIDEIKKNPAQQRRRIEGWGKYYKQQAIIITVLGETDLEQELLEFACKPMGLKLDQVAFVVSMPLSFLHLHDFKSGMAKASTKFCFLKDGKVATEDNTGLGTISYERAYVEVLKRASGVDIETIVPEVPETALLTEKEEQELEAKKLKLKENLNLWLEKFKKLPAVESVELADGENPDRLAVINVRTAFPKENCVAFYTLDIGNSYDAPNWSQEGEPSQVYEKWCHEGKSNTWEEFYQALVELSNLYVTIPQV